MVPSECKIGLIGRGFKMETHTLSHKLANLRKTRGLTQRALASELNYSDKVISKWERGESSPDIHALRNIARFFNVSLDTLLGEDPEFSESSRSERPYKGMEAKRVKGPPRLLGWTLIPLTALFLSTLFGPIDLFILGALIYGFLLLTYSVVMAYNTWRLDYMGHVLIIKNRPMKASLTIDGRLTDQNASIFSRGVKLQGTVDKKTFKVFVSSLFTMRCTIIVEIPQA